jgi:hypothetical protein
LGYKAKQGYVIYRIRVRRGCRKKQVHLGKTMGKPKNQGVNQIKPKRNRRSVAEERCQKRCPNLRVLNSYWINQVRKTTTTTFLFLSRSGCETTDTQKESVLFLLYSLRSDQNF